MLLENNCDAYAGLVQYDDSGNNSSCISIKWQVLDFVHAVSSWNDDNQCGVKMAFTMGIVAQSVKVMSMPCTCRLQTLAEDALTFTERRRMPGSPSAGPKAKLALRFMPFLPDLPLLEPLCPVLALPRPAPTLFAWVPADDLGAVCCNKKGQLMSADLCDMCYVCTIRYCARMGFKSCPYCQICCSWSP